MRPLIGATVQAFALGFVVVLGVIAFALVVAAFVLFLLSWLMP